jgi:hypothetical protein
VSNSSDQISARLSAENLLDGVNGEHDLLLKLTGIIGSDLEKGWRRPFCGIRILHISKELEAASY